MDHPRPVLAVLAVVACGFAACDGGSDDAADTLAPVGTPAPTTAAPATVAPTTAAPTTAAPTTAAPTTAAPTTAAPTTVAPTTAAPTTAAPTTTATPTTAAPPTTEAPATLTLRRDGLGVAQFGDAADDAVAAVRAALGDPTDDSGWVDPFTISSCAGTEVRRVSWGALSLLLGDPSGGDARRFFAYSYGDVAEIGAAPAGLTTPEGIGIGVPVADLRAAYPDVEVSPGEEGLIPAGFYVDENLFGLLTGDSPTDSVTVVFGGPFCG